VAERAAGVAMRGLGWVLAALGVAVCAHLGQLPAWATMTLLAAAGWRYAAARVGWALPPSWARTLAAVASLLVVLATFRTLNGVQAGTALLTMMAAVKLLETRTERDLTVLVFIALFMLYAGLLRDQGIARLPLLLAGALVATAALHRVHGGAAAPAPVAVLGSTAALAWPAVPLALLLFVLFPRLPGPFWGVAVGQSARTGLNDEIMLGDVSDLSVSGEVAFRVRFDGPIPPPAQRYWRGPVLHEFDGRRWRRPVAQSFPDQAVSWVGAPVDYQITLEPHDRPWILALDLPAAWPEREARRNYDFQLTARRPVTRVTSYRLRSYPAYAAGVELPVSLRNRDLQLPAEGNPRTLALGRDLARRHAHPLDMVGELLRKFRRENYRYTLDPPRLAQDAVDEFLFETRSGFCEHYAAAFTMVMRAAGVPARIVTGYQGGEYNPLGGYLLVRQSDAHAWSEIWVAGRGWLRVDPTGAVAPDRIERGVPAAAADQPALARIWEDSQLVSQAQLLWDYVNDFWNERIVRFDARLQLSLLQRLGVDAPDWRTLVLGLTAAFAAFFVGVSAWLAWTHRVPDRDWPERLHGQAAARLAIRGVVRRAAEGPVDYLDRAAAHCPDLRADLEAIRALYIALRYGPAPVAEDLQRLKYRVGRLRP
jgi:transglutaminase-like putative cysteine protease